MKFGALPRAYDPAVPSLASVMRLAAPVTLPPTLDYTANCPGNMSMMGNDAFGNCAFAAAYHNIQVYSTVSRHVCVTEPDAKVLQAYSEVTGFNPADPATDQGTVLQDALKYMMKTGLPILPAPAPRDRHRITGFFEIDPRSDYDIKRAIYEAGSVYIGFQVPVGFDTNGMLWDVGRNVQMSGDGHCVILAGYELNGDYVTVSWGSRNYRMTQRFVRACVTEIYALMDPTWMTATGKTILGLTPAQLADQMRALA